MFFPYKLIVSRVSAAPQKGLKSSKKIFKNDNNFLQEFFFSTRHICNNESWFVFADWETESESGEEDDEGEGKVKDGETSQDSSQLWQQDESSSGDEDSPQCPICLARLKSQDMGTPDTCDHTFCLDCLLEWSKVS